MIKVQIVDACQHCDGEAYFPSGQGVSASGEIYQQYRPCPKCDGSGKATRWIGLGELADLLVEELGKSPFELDYRQLARQRFATQYRESLDSSGL